MNTVMRTAFAAALQPHHKHNGNKIYRALRSDVGTKSRTMYADPNPVAYPAHQLRG